MKFKFVTVTFNDYNSGVVTNRDIVDDEGETIPLEDLAPGQVVQAYWQAEKDVFPAIVRRISGLLLFSPLLFESYSDMITIITRH